MNIVVNEGSEASHTAQVWEALLALRKEQNTLHKTVVDMCAVQKALCAVLTEMGLLDTQRLLQECHRQHFAAVRRAHPSECNNSLISVLGFTDSACAAARFMNPQDYAGLCATSRALARSMSEASSALIPSRLLVCGGRGPGGTLSSAELFDRTSGWEALSPMSEERQGASAAVMRGCFHVCGGETRNGRLLSSAECFDPGVGSWRSLPSMSYRRRVAASAVTHHHWYICGGDGTRGLLNTVERFDALLEQWESLSAMSVERGVAGAAVMQDHVYVVGGYNGFVDDPLEYEALRSAERFDGTWVTLQAMTYGRWEFAIAVIADSLYVCGGDVIGQALNAVERYNPSIGVWELLRPMRECRSRVASAVLGGKLYICGGHGMVGEDRVALCSVECFDPANDTWEELPPMTQARWLSAAVVLDGCLVVCGGLGEGQYSSVEQFSSATRKWQALPHLTSARFNPLVSVIAV